MYRSPSESERLEAYVQKRCADADYVQNVLDQNDENYAQYRRHAKEYLDRDFKKATPRELADALEAHRQSLLQMASSISCSIIFAGALARRLQQTLPETAVMMMALPLHETLPLEEETRFWELVDKIQQAGAKNVAEAGLNIELKDAISGHFHAFCWLDAYENDATWTRTAFNQRLAEALALPAGKKLAEMEKHHHELEKQIEKTARTHHVDPVALNQFRLAMYHRILGESLLGLGNYATHGLFTAIAKALHLPRNQIKWFSDMELLAALRGDISAERHLEKLPARQKHYLVALGETNVHTYDGSDADEILTQLDIEKPPVAADITEVKGVSAYPGKVSGIARVVNHVGELDKVKAGDILVTLNTTPTFILAMKRSAAIVTDEGGITCHAAIVSRELGIPCIIGTKSGTRLIQDGSHIEVDATKGTVTKLE
ncbi:hypothetical protein HY994_02235 [Candidatus Micrarchaeota archaeon]|nr:hypothetical protein [Candidatus Micrarchaeota archaeon]